MLNTSYLFPQSMSPEGKRDAFRDSQWLLYAIDVLMCIMGKTCFDFLVLVVDRITFRRRRRVPFLSHVPGWQRTRREFHDHLFERNERKQASTYLHDKVRRRIQSYPIVIRCTAKRVLAIFTALLSAYRHSYCVVPSSASNDGGCESLSR